MLPNSSFNREVQITNPEGQTIDAIFTLTYVVHYTVKDLSAVSVTLDCMNRF